MNITALHFEDHYTEFSFGGRPASQPDASGPSRKREDGRRRRRAPQQFNGIHRRRRKKIRW